MSDSNATLFAEFLKWKESHSLPGLESSRNNSVPTASVVGDAGLLESGLQLGSKDATSSAPATISNTAESPNVDTDVQASAGCTDEGSNPETGFTADDYLSRKRNSVLQRNSFV